MTPCYLVDAVLSYRQHAPPRCLDPNSSNFDICFGWLSVLKLHHWCSNQCMLQTGRSNALLECRASASNFRRRSTSRFKHFRLMFRNLVSTPLSLISESPSPCLTPVTVHSAHSVHWCVALCPYNEQSLLSCTTLTGIPNSYILIMKANEMHNFSYLFDKILYMFRTGPLSIIRSISTLYTRNRYCASDNQQNYHEEYILRVYSVEILLMMDSGPVRNM